MKDDVEIDPSLTRKLLFSNLSSSSSSTSSSSSSNKIAPDALQAAGELIRQFIIETRHRASIGVRFFDAFFIFECSLFYVILCDLFILFVFVIDQKAEFEHEMNNRNVTYNAAKSNRSNVNDSSSDDGSSIIASPLSSPPKNNDNTNNNNKKRKRKNEHECGLDNDENGDDNKCYYIQPKHILKVSAEILMDFS